MTGTPLAFHDEFGFAFRLDAGPSVEAVEELLAALRRAKEIIRVWHDMSDPVNQSYRDDVWRLYQASPEMTVINAAIAKAEKVHR